MLKHVFFEADRDGAASDEVAIDVVAVAGLVGEVEVEALRRQQADARGNPIEVFGLAIAGRIRGEFGTTARWFLVEEGAAA